ncbi:hypothetical protein EG329_000109 [Mollisiaceae sp. DMI_Dod_QoI]|nr:hypothetical protein EG329_000109 [Helotiales sp. DMI_Dod_QoI]
MHLLTITSNVLTKRADSIELPLEQRDIAVKDNIVTKSTLTTCASQMLQYYRSPFDASVVQELQERMATVVGKTNLDEFGMGSHSTNSIFGPVTNTPPFHNISVGGSSGGSAIAVATERCGMALGTDTGGSVRLPASYTGITGFKPSYGYISRWGVVPYANSLDTVGILAPSAAPIKLAFACASHPDVRDPTSLTASTRSRIRSSIDKGKKEERRRRIALGQWESANDISKFLNLRIGVPIEYNIEELDPGVRRVWRNTLKLLEHKGATLVPISLPNTKHALSAYYVLAPAEAASNLSKYDGVRYGTRSDGYDGAGHVLFSNTRGSGFGEEVKRRILLGSYTLSSEAIDNYFLKAQKVRRLVQRDFDRVFAVPNPLKLPEQFDLSDLDDSIPMQDKLGPPQVDVIVCPTAPTIAPHLSDVSEQTPVDTYMNDVFTVPASLAGLPAISVPFTVPKGYRVPRRHVHYVGIQIIGQFGDDKRVIEIAQRLEGFRDARNQLEGPIGRRYTDVPAKQASTDRPPPIRKVSIEVSMEGENSSFPSEKSLPWKQYGSELTATPRIRMTPTYEPKQRNPKTDAEIKRDLEDALAIWEQIQKPKEE